MDDLKLEEIKKRVEALVLAYKMRKDIKAMKKFFERMGFGKRARFERKPSE